jgi:hypothetical protein
VVDAAPDTEGAVNDALLRLTQEKLFLILRDFEVDAKRVKKTDITFLAKAGAGPLPGDPEPVGRQAALAGGEGRGRGRRHRPQGWA